MKKIVIFSALAAVAVVASAQEQGRVLSATPIIQQVGVPQQVCGNETVYSGNRTTGAGAVIGAIAGGAVGNTICRAPVHHPHPERSRPLDPRERAARWPDLFHTARPVCGPGRVQPAGGGDLHLPCAAGVPGAPTYVTPPVTVIEYGYDSGRPYYPHHRNPYWR